MSKRKSAAGSSTTPAASTSTVPSSTKSAHTSSLLRSAFAPSKFQLHLFASVIQSFDSQHLRIHDTNTNRLRAQHSTKPGTRITCLDWGYYGTSYRESSQSSARKKRKKTNNDTESVVLAYGTLNSEICMFSLAEGKTIGTLAGAHERGIRDFKFSSHNYSEGWSLGEDARLAQWDLATDKVVRYISLSDSATLRLAPPCLNTPKLLCASSAPATINLMTDDDFRIETFDSFKNPVRVLLRSQDEPDASAQSFLAADSDRYINVYDIESHRISRTLITASGVDNADISSNSASLLAVSTADGIVELFTQPFQTTAATNGDTISRRKTLTKKSSAQIKLVNSRAKGVKVPIFSVSIQGNDVVVAHALGGIDVSFQKITCLDEDTGELMFDGLREVPAVLASSTLQGVHMNGVKDLGRTNVDESQTVVVNGGTSTAEDAAIAISSSEDESEVDEDSNDEEMLDAEVAIDQEEGESDGNSESDSDGSADRPNSNAVVMTGVQDMTADTKKVGEDADEPTFGQLLASRHPDTIAIIDNATQDISGLSKTDTANLALNSGISLGTVLTQALRTNDRSLLESCLHTTNEDIVRNTVQRLESPLAAILLTRLAERLASRPGRVGSLLTWVRWTCIAHGSAIALQPEVSIKLRTLYKVLSQRSRSLDNLLLLKGKLDMLDAQLTYRNQLQAQRATTANNKHDPNEPGLIIIEGQADQWSSEDEYDEGIDTIPRSKSKSKTKTKTLKALPALDPSDISSDESDINDKPLVNGVKDINSSSAEEETSDEDDDEARPLQPKHNHIIDDEAEESGDDQSDLEDDENTNSNSSDNNSDDNNEEEEEEYDSDMDSFINDGSISEVTDQGDINLDDDQDEEVVDDIPQKPKSKRSKLR